MNLPSTADTSAGSVEISGEDGTQTIDFTPTPWTPEETEHYTQTGETPLARLHRQNLEAQWGTDTDPT